MPARYLLDTNICIYIAKRRPPEVLRHFERLQVGDVAMSIITYGELHFGAEKSQYSVEAHNKLVKLAEFIPILPMPVKAAGYYGRIRALLERTGKPIGANDLWIAAHAMAENLILVSNNTGEFSRIPDILLENWAD
ncbi:MAG: plasmid maintenance protein [Deltaproteobacteria bacterium RIFOXYD12_FULL_50_9]|nr:MAG: plasmid maintenance protein [Deltaproteobacteria bacterium RIFOXYD12_FULL_50_9]